MNTKELAHTLVAHAIRIEKGGSVTSSELAAHLRHILTLELEEGGPYALPESRLADLGLNLAIGRFLQACGVRLEKLESFLVISLAPQTCGVSDLFSDGELAQLADAYRIRLETAHIDQDPPAPEDDDAQLVRDVVEEALRAFQELPRDMRERAIALVERIIVRNTDRQIPLITKYVQRALGISADSDAQVLKLGAMNVLFWAAIKVYDDFWDEDEDADPKLLPIANLCMRAYVRHFSTLFQDTPAWDSFFGDMMDKLDAANAWETTACRMRVEGNIVHMPERIPSYGDHGIKFYPACGQVMGPVALMMMNGCAVDDGEVASMVEYFRHYLIAMQLNDDAHDWKEDLGRGHISTVVAAMLSVWASEYPERKQIDLEADMHDLERIFWYEVLKPICENMLSHAARARRTLHSMESIRDHRPLEKFIVRNEHIAQQALDERARSDEFLVAFGDN